MPIALPQALRYPITNIPLRWILVVPFVLQTVGAVVLVGYLSYRNGQQATSDLADRLIQEKGDQIALYLERTLEVPHQINQLNADSIQLGQLSGFETQAPAPLEKILWTQLLRFPDVTSIAFANERGGMVGSARVYQPQSISMSVYRTPQFSRGTYSLSTTDAQGEIIETKIIAQNYDARTRPWYQTPARAGKATWSPIYQYVSHLQSLGISAGLPYMTSGKLQGVLTADINLKKLNEFLSGLHISSSGQVFIIERSGLLVASSTNQSLFTTQPGKQERLKAGESKNPVMRETMAQLAKQFGNLADIEAAQQFTLEQSSPQFGRVIPFQDPYGLDWLIVVVIPESDFMAAIQHNARQTLLLCLLTLGVAITLGLLTANKLIARFVQLNRVSRELAAGNLNQRLPTDSPIYELNSLAQTFNQMAEQLQQSFDRVSTALAESEEKFTTVFRTSPDPIAIVNLAEGRILEVNDSLIEFFGYSRLEIIGRTRLELNLWNSLDQYHQYGALLQQQGSIRNLEAQFRTKPGEVKTVLLSAEVQTLAGQDCVIVVCRDVSDRKAVETTLQRYERIVSATTDAISLVDRQYRYQMVNQAYLNWNNKLYTEIVGHSISDLIGQEVFETVIQPRLDRCLAGETIQYHEWFELPELGRQFLSITYSPYLEIDQTISGIVVNVRNITSLKQAEAALQASEMRFRELAETVREGFFVFETESFDYSYVNSAYAAMKGTPFRTSQQDIAYWLDKVHPDDRDRIEAGLQQELQGKNFDQEYRLIRPDGEMCWLHSRSFPLPDETGTIVRVVGTVEDISNRKQAEMALQESEARFQEIAQTINQVFYVISLTTGQYLYISPAYEKLWGNSCESLYQNPRSWLERIHPEDLDPVLWGFDQLLSGDQTRLQYRIISANGEVHWIESESLVVQDENGNPLRVVGVADDITHRKQLEQSLRTQAEEERLLNSITQHIRQSLDLKQILATTVIEVQQTLKADRVLIFQLHQDGSGQVIQEAVLPEYPMIKQMQWLDECFPDECYEYYRQGTPRIVPDVATDEWASCLAEFMQEAGVKSKVVAPIVQVEAFSREVWGLLIVHACSHYRQWQEAETDFLQRICNQLAIGIDQSNLYQQLQTELAERKQAEAALRQSEARLAMAQQVSQVGYWEFDFETQKRTWSEITFPQWGLDPAQPEPSWEELLQMVHPDDHAALQQSREKTITEGIPYALDLRVVHPDGSIHYLDSRAEPVFNAQGQIVKLIGTSVDITERKQTEKALQERESMLRAIGDNLPKGFIYQRVYEPGKGFYYSYVSAGIERLLGIKPEALLENPKVIRKVGFDEDLARADQLVQESLKNLSAIEIQMRNRTTQGDIQWSSIRSTPRRLEDGRTVWDGVEVDITELKHIEAALRASEDLFRRAFDDAPIGISLVSTTGQFVKVNSRYCDLLGYTEAELLSLTFREITHPADLEVDLAGFQQMMAGEIRSFELEKRYITKQGTVLPVQMHAGLIRDQNQQPLYCVGQVQDIRDRLKVERMKDEFISIISHELRTPLTSIRGALGILGSGIFDDRPAKAQHMLQIAINNSDRLVRLVNDILSLERLESGKVQLVMEHCQVTNLIQQAIDSVQAIADQSAVTLSVTPLAATLWADPDAIIQTLTNLLSNAIKFSSPGDTVRLKAEIGKGEAEIGNRVLSDLPNPFILFTIRDQGRGIPEDKLEVIFEQFQQVDVSDSRNKGGTGLGLAICKNIVQQHSGQIWVESILGEGSTFYVTLPLIRKDKSNSESD